jgi:hypothetical protein
MQTKLYRFVALWLSLFLFTSTAFAQITLSTLQTSAGVTNGSGSPSTAITFTVQNSNAYGIILQKVGLNSGSTNPATLYYSSTSLTGAAGPVPGTPWTLIATNNSPTSMANTVVDDNFWPNVNLLIPANTTYRFCVLITPSSNRMYYGTASVPPAQTSFTSNGVTLANAGGYWGGSNTISSTGYFFIGSITFINACFQPAGLNATNITYNSADLSWTPTTGSNGYEYEVSTSSTPPLNGTPISITSLAATGLNSSTTYYLHVRNMCAATNISNWTTYSFTTAVNPCAPATGVNVHAPTATTANITWPAVAGTLGYEYKLDQIPGNPVTAGTPTTTTTYNATGLTGGQTYYFHLRHKCSSTNSWSDWNNTQFVMPECKKPENILFANITGTDVDVIWSVMAAANYYQYQVDQTTSDPTGGSGYNTTTAMTAHLSALTPNVKYYIHIRSMCFVNDSSDWALDSFVTTAVCGIPNLTVNNPNTSAPDAYWQPVDNAVAYEWAMRPTTTPPSFGSEVYTTFLPPISLPADNKDYYLHVRTKCNSMFHFSNWATAVLRETPNSVQNVNQAFDIAVYPNPAKDAVTLDVTDFSKEASYSITDVSGRVVMQDAVTSAATVINISRLAPGVYMLKYEDGDNKKMVKVNKI